MSIDNLPSQNDISNATEEEGQASLTLPEADPMKKPHRIGKKTYITLASIIFILAFVVFCIYWFLVLRFQQNTDDAYVVGVQVPIIAQIDGNVTEVFFDNTDLVNAGDTMVVLDKTNATLAYESAKYELANAVRQIQTLYQENIAYKAEIDEQRVLLAQAEQNYKRRIPLGVNDAISKETLQHAKEAVQIARASLAVAIQKLKSNEAVLLDTEPNKQPSILAAANKVREAWINLERTVVRAPVTGYVARRNVQVGDEVSPTSTLMAIVPTEPMWVDANFKETQLENIRIGQPVKMTSELYGSNVVYDGTVTGLDMGTGSAFSLLPAQNATGNWIKIVQRLPVRVDLNPGQLKDNPLRIGLSMNVTVDIKNASGAVLEITRRTEPAFKSDILVLDLDQVNNIIEKIIEENSFIQEQN